MTQIYLKQIYLQATATMIVQVCFEEKVVSTYRAHYTKQQVCFEVPEITYKKSYRSEAYFLSTIWELKIVSIEKHMNNQQATVMFGH
jgi:hypothetical protein